MAALMLFASCGGSGRRLTPAELAPVGASPPTTTGPPAAAPTHYYSTDAIGFSPTGYRYGWVSSADETCLFTGTSAAAPLVTGAAALVQSKYLNWTPQQVKNRFRASIIPLPDTSVPGRIDVVLATQ